MTTVLIGIDDTDNENSPGTGQLARRVSNEITRLGGKPLGITRHQFLIDPKIPYTAHNRGICVATEWARPLSELGFVFELVGRWSADGSDPGVCVTASDAVPPAIVGWGESAMHMVLTMEECYKLAQRVGLNLRALGGTGQGIIGALASVGLRVGGQHGRFVDMPGLRELGDGVSAEKLAAMGITLEHQVTAGAAETGGRGNYPNSNTYKTLGWVRPRLSQGKAILVVEWSEDHEAWVPVDRKKIHPMDQG